MKEIKFRFWEDVAKKMFTHEMLIEYEWSYRQINKPREYQHFMQYTGLKDKNGKEIYEGDVVKHRSLEYIAKVEWPRWVDRGTGYDYEELDDFHFEVIGNVWENPELLNS